MRRSAVCCCCCYLLIAWGCRERQDEATDCSSWFLVASAWTAHMPAKSGIREDWRNLRVEGSSYPLGMQEVRMLMAGCDATKPPGSLSFLACMTGQGLAVKLP